MYLKSTNYSRDQWAGEALHQETSGFGNTVPTSRQLTEKGLSDLQYIQK